MLNGYSWLFVEKAADSGNANASSTTVPATKSVQDAEAEVLVHGTTRDLINYAVSGQLPTSSDVSTSKMGNKHSDADASPLVSKSAVLRLLSEFVRSYVGCAQAIVDHRFSVGQSDVVTDDCSALAFILDHLLPSCQELGDRECPAMTRMLIASMAACTHAPDMQSSLVGELKVAIQRTLALPESTVKHTKLQCLISLVMTMVEACPTPGYIPNQVFKVITEIGIFNRMIMVF